MYTTSGYLNEIATISNFAHIVDAAGFPSLSNPGLGDPSAIIILDVPCRIAVNSSREALEQNRILGRTLYVGRFSSRSANGTLVTLNSDSLIAVGGVTYLVKSPARPLGVSNSPVFEVDLEVKS